MKIPIQIKQISTMYDKLSDWGKILLFCIIFLLVVVFFKSNKEGYEDRKSILQKRGGDVYDGFYVSIYDHLVYNTMKDDYEIGEIINKTRPTSKSVILDVGSGTGHHVAKLSEQGLNVMGIDNSTDMVEMSKKNYPTNKFIRGDVTGNVNFNHESFTHILCLYFTIYYFKNKQKFFNNCIKWLLPGGYLVLHIVDRETFDPILPAGQGFLIVSPQKYAKKRITSSKVTFNNFVYSSNFDLDTTQNIATFNEKFKFNDGGKMRTNEHVMYMEDLTEILMVAQNEGFIIDGKIDLVNCGYDNQYLYILVKPS
jgi:SAM-dependent methyltransferase